MDKIKLDEIVQLEVNDVTTENGNINAVVPSGIMMKFASLAAKEYAHEVLLSQESREAVDNNLIHIHDLDYYPTRSLTCLQHPLDKVLEGGFVASDGTARPCKRIESAAELAAISIQTVTNEMHGGQAIPAFDFYFAPFVKATFLEEFEKACETVDSYDPSDVPVMEFLKETGGMEAVWEYIATEGYTVTENPQTAVDIAINFTVKRVHQAMEGFIHNMNTMRSRGGGQVPFSSINYGTDTSPEGRLIIREILTCTLEGVGNGQTALFPIQIWKLKAGVSAEPGDPNYDLLELATQCTAKRYFPNYINLDAPFNHSDKWDANDPKRYMYEPATMGCRTRVFENRFGDNTSVGRGNLSFTTINLPRIALMSANYAEFLINLEKTVDVAVRQLIDRYEWQATGRKKQFPMLMSGMWLDSEKLATPETPVSEVMKHGTLGVGFIGLAECLTRLTGYHHAEHHQSQLLGLAIVSEINDRCKYWADRFDLNISVLATPAEGLAGKFVRKDRADFGTIPGVTDRDYYTNSNHVPVWYQISYEDKLKIEAPYHALTLGGHIAYLEVDGNPEQNPEAIMDMVQRMRYYKVGYGSINYARARCLDCGYEDGSVKFDACPQCGSENVDVLERITGYLVGSLGRWNSGKKAEVKDRVSHVSGETVIK